MSKDNMEELQRYWTETDNPHTFSENADGAFVRFSDVEEREARFQARIEELAQDRDDMTDTILGLRERIEDWLSKQVRSLLDSGEEQDEARTGGVGVADMEAMLIRQQALRDHLYEEARRKLSGESGLPVSQGMVRDGEVIARLHNLDSHRNPHWSDEENRAYSLGVRNAIHVIEHPEEENQSAEAGQPRSVLAREGGEE